MISYSTWRDQRTGTWEVVRWQDRKATVVQRNIVFKSKAIEACEIWRRRQQMNDMLGSIEATNTQLRGATK